MRLGCQGEESELYPEDAVCFARLKADKQQGRGQVCVLGSSQLVRWTDWKVWLESSEDRWLRSGPGRDEALHRDPQVGRCRPSEVLWGVDTTRMIQLLCMSGVRGKTWWFLGFRLWEDFCREALKEYGQNFKSLIILNCSLWNSTAMVAEQALRMRKALGRYGL